MLRRNVASLIEPLAARAVAEALCEEAALALGSAMPSHYPLLLAAKVRDICEHNPAFVRRLRRADGREWLYAFMRHWLAATIKRRLRAEFHRLPKGWRDLDQ